MSYNLDIDCGNVFSQFNTEGKFANASKKILNGKNSTYKISKTTVEYGIATAEILSIIPEQFALLFALFKSIKTAMFESWGISRRVIKIKNSYQKESAFKEKFNKWNQNSAKLSNLICLDSDNLLQLKAKYTNKFNKIEANQNTEHKKIRWLEYLENINSALSNNHEANLDLLNKLKERNKNKLSKHKDNLESYKFQIKKNYIGIAISIGLIAIEVISLFALAYTSIGGIITFTAIKVSSNLAISCLKYFKFLWISKIKNENLHTIAIKSIDHIGVAVLKTKLLPTPDYIHPSLIQGGCQSILSTISIFQRSEEYFDYIEDIRRCKSSITKLEKKRIRLLSYCERIAAGNYQTLLDEKKRLSDKLAAAEFNRGAFKKGIELNKDNDQLKTQILMFKRKIIKYNERLEIVDRALETNHLADAEKVSNTRIAGTEKKLSDWKSSKKLVKTKNKIEIMKTVLSIVEIARFAFLTLSVFLTVIGVGFNLIPALFVSSLISNAIYIGYYWQNSKSVDQINLIYERWKGNEQHAA